MKKDLLKEFLNGIKEEEDLKPFHIKITHGDEIVFDECSKAAFIVAESEDEEWFNTTCYTKTDLATILLLLEKVTSLRDKIVDNIKNKILGD